MPSLPERLGGLIPSQARRTAIDAFRSVTGVKRVDENAAAMKASDAFFETIATGYMPVLYPSLNDDRITISKEKFRFPNGITHVESTANVIPVQKVDLPPKREFDLHSHFASENPITTEKLARAQDTLLTRGMQSELHPLDDGHVLYVHQPNSDVMAAFAVADANPREFFVKLATKASEGLALARFDVQNVLEAIDRQNISLGEDMNRQKKSGKTEPQSGKKEMFASTERIKRKPDMIEHYLRMMRAIIESL